MYVDLFSVKKYKLSYYKYVFFKKNENIHTAKK